MTLRIRRGGMCIYAKSSMTPCYLKNGDLAIAIDTSQWGSKRKICVGCEKGIKFLREQRAQQIGKVR